ncbi:MAG: metal-sensing transcriptional repressor [Vulcanimicrobiaceae bacterium]
MQEPHLHHTHPAIITRLKRVVGHLNATIGMIEVGRPCLELAQQLHAIEKAVCIAKKKLIHDHIDHCLDSSAPNTNGGAHSLDEFKTITKYL